MKHPELTLVVSVTVAVVMVGLVSIGADALNDYQEHKERMAMIEAGMVPPSKSDVNIKVKVDESRRRVDE